MFMRAIELIAGAFTLGSCETENPDVGDCICCVKSCKMDDAHPSIWDGDYEISGPICVSCANTVGHNDPSDGELVLRPNFYYDLDEQEIKCACPDTRIPQIG